MGIQSAPVQPIIEIRDRQQLLNFDMETTSQAAVAFVISQIDLSVYDASGHLELPKSLNTDAFAPSIEIIGDRVLLAGKSLDIFNPFYEFSPT